MAISGAVFDFGGVITKLTMPDFVRPIMEELGVPWNLLEDGFGKYRRLMDGDLMTMDEMYVKIFAEAGLEFPDDVIGRIVDRDQASYTLRNEETIEFMKDLKARGFKIGILTNMCRSFVPRFKENFADAITLADALVISGEERMHKPEKRIYELLRSRLGLEPRELCFFDDVEMNCEG
ncbi:MAG: HAD hydrolase-like protein, partial [Kiritimatiellae bacterium]|nr:HAD hydrolase-like protein [Kiritimatiellia bacterium]